MNKPVIYTACFGDHDKPVDIPGLEGIADLCCFTDQPDLAERLPSFRTFVRRPVFRTSRMDAKWYKMSACHLFPDHDWSIYIDASVRVKDPRGLISVVHGLLDQPKHHGLAFFEHPENPARSLEEEARFSMTMGKYAGEPCIEQVAHYRASGFFAHDPGYHLLAGGCIGRKHWTGIDLFEKMWLDECVHWSCQDQLSLPYVLWKTRVGYAREHEPGIIPGSIYNGDLLCRIWSGPNR